MSIPLPTQKTSWPARTLWSLLFSIRQHQHQFPKHALTLHREVLSHKGRQVQRCPGSITGRNRPQWMSHCTVPNRKNTHSENDRPEQLLVEVLNLHLMSCLVSKPPQPTKIKKERYQDYKRLLSTHRNKLVVFTWPSTMNGLLFFDWLKGSHRPARKHYRLLPINLMVRSYCWRHHVLIKHGEKELVLHLTLRPYWLVKQCTIWITGGEKAIISLNKLQILWQQGCPAYKIQPLVQ